ncbi:globin domain-containing protein [Longispora sp. NPDC051575]|uniref:globin domain-containing protein n=1 Tax=Longispora sp. NPDC051575 TaxID=3154943 RepID=UPI00341A33A9
MSTLSRLLKESWTSVEERGDTLAANFYARVFLADPQLRELFPVTMDVQRSRLLEAIVQAVQTVDDPDAFAAYLTALGRDHRKFHTRPEHYDVVGACLIAALAEHAGDAWGPEFEQAWRDAYAVIAATMIAGAAEAADQPAYWHAEVLRHERHGTDLARFTVRPLEPVPYRAGQYVSLETAHRPRLWRSYSVANAPRADGTMDFHARAVSATGVSSALVRTLRAGDMLRIGAPMGSMTLDLGSAHDMVFVAGGTGLAPLRALLEQLAETNRSRAAHLFLGVRHTDDLYDLPALTAMAVEHPWLTFTPVVSEQPDSGYPHGLVGEVCAAAGPWPEHDFYVAGSAAMVRATRTRLAEAGVPYDRIRYDALTTG